MVNIKSTREYSENILLQENVRKIPGQFLDVSACIPPSFFQVFNISNNIIYYYIVIWCITITVSLPFKILRQFVTDWIWSVGVIFTDSLRLNVSICNYLQWFAIVCNYLQLFLIISDYLQLFQGVWDDRRSCAWLGSPSLWLGEGKHSCLNVVLSLVKISFHYMF